MAFAATDEVTELSFHVLAHVPMDGPGRSWDPGYLAWLAREGGDDEARAMAEDDGVLVARALAIEPARELVHLLPELHRDVAALVRCSAHALAEVAPADVRRPEILAAMQRASSPAFELCHAMLGLALGDHRRRFARTIAPALALAAEELGGLRDDAGPLAVLLDDRPVELAWALGPRGRAFAGRIVVGAPAPWHTGGIATSFVIALHERFVCAQADGDWAMREWAALCGLAGAITGARASLQEAHGRWLARLDLGMLLDELVARGVIERERAVAIDGALNDRATLLRER